jgi:hypothetical protein
VYGFVRTDLIPAQQAVQVSHAAIEMARAGLVPEGAEPPHLVLCDSRGVDGLVKLSQLLDAHNVAYRTFSEDYGNGPELTALVTQPIAGEQRKLFKKQQCLKAHLPQTKGVHAKSESS